MIAVSGPSLLCSRPASTRRPSQDSGHADNVQLRAELSDYAPAVGGKLCHGHCSSRAAPARRIRNAVLCIMAGVFSPRRRAQRLGLPAPLIKLAQRGSVAASRPAIGWRAKSPVRPAPLSRCPSALRNSSVHSSVCFPFRFPGIYRVVRAASARLL